MPVKRPYSVEDEQSVCYDCVYNERCSIRSDKTYECEWGLTEEDEIRIQQRKEDLTFLAKSKAGARLLIDKINTYVFNAQPFTGNSTTHYNLGERGVVMSELRILLDVLDLDTYTELVIYLNNTIKGVNNVRTN